MLFIVIYEIGDVYHFELAKDYDTDRAILFNSETEAQAWAEENCSGDFRIIQW